MSGLPILPAVTGQPALARISSAAAQAVPGQVVPAAGKPTISSHVQPTSLLQKTEQASRHVLSSALDKRSRLIGPPPTFEVNLLQHLQDTWLEPPDKDTDSRSVAIGPRDISYTEPAISAQPDTARAVLLDLSV